MNKQSKSLGKRSTNTASLSNAILSIKSSISPVIKTGRVSANPKPLKGNTEMWIPRTVRIYQSLPTTSPGVALTVAQIVANAAISGQIRVLGIKSWNYTNPGSTTNYINVVTELDLTETGVSTSVNDVGSSDHLPGVSVMIPRTIASNRASSSTYVLITTSATPSGNPTVVQTFVHDVHFEYKTNSSN